jgi:hypothetical protein
VGLIGVSGFGAPGFVGTGFVGTGFVGIGSLSGMLCVLEGGARMVVQNVVTVVIGFELDRTFGGRGVNVSGVSTAFLPPLIIGE